MLVAQPLIEGKLIRRYKRFLMDLAMADGSVTTVHCPNSGSMEGCLLEGATVLASKAANEKRWLPYTAEWIRLPTGWVGINTHRTNLIAGEALRGRRVPGLEAYTAVRAEVPYGRHSRVDFLLEGDGLPPCHVEVKNTTWPTPDGGVGFPDTVTERGLKHVGELRKVVRAGGRAVFLFLVNREDGAFFRPAVEKDPAYTKALASAVRAGLEVMAFRTEFRIPEVSLGEALPVVQKRGKTLKPFGP